MKRLLVVFGIVLLVASFAIAGAPKGYQVTGPVLEFDGDPNKVEKGKDKWELAVEKDTKITGEVKPGAKVEIQYKMVATSITVKAEPKKEKAPAKKSEPAPKK